MRVMDNILNYYYSLHPSVITKENDNYFFEDMGNRYVLQPFNRPISDVEALYNVNKEMLKRNILVHEIILNNENKILTYIDNIPYILMEIFINKDARIKLSDVCYINNSSVGIEYYDVLNRRNWATLWEMKNDYFEMQINEIGKKYYNLCNIANYYIGLAENAICYVKEIEKIEGDVLVSICNKRICCDKSLFSVYNPLNYICDYRVRDISEYIKSVFFSNDNNSDALELIKEYFENNYIGYKEALLFYARLLYPSYFFDLYDEIVNNDLNEKLANDIILKADDYEKFLFDVHLYLSKLYNRYIPGIDWIIKRSF